MRTTMAVPPSVGARFRQRKISVKQTLQILRQPEVPDLEKEDQQRELQHVETGVEKHEETEVHLQRIMKMAGATGGAPTSAPATAPAAAPASKKDAGAVSKPHHQDQDQDGDQGQKQQEQQQQQQQQQQQREQEQENKFFIPTPDASKLWKDAKKYYTGTYNLSNSYLKTSATVEDTVGVPYCMDEEDEEWLNKFNSNEDNNNNDDNKNNESSVSQQQQQENRDKKKPNSLSEDEFELLVDTFERVINEKQPFITIDPTEILGFDQIKEYALTPDKTSPTAVKDSLKKEMHVDSFVTLLDPANAEEQEKNIRPLETLLQDFGNDVYVYWKRRRIERQGQPLTPQLKFEDPSDRNNDDDPFVCFRRREFRQQRKTRKTDMQSAEKLRRLHIELKSVKLLVSLVAQRELKRQESIKLEREVFEDRCHFKSLKRELGIKGDEEDLVQHKKKKIIPPPPPPVVPQTSRKEEVVKTKEEKSKKEKIPKAQKAAVSQEELKNVKKQMATSHITAQPYVKLPASKIPDMELESVSQVLMNKNHAIERAVNEKLRQRMLNENNADWINLTDDSMNPFFTLSNAHADIKEYSHLPYSSIVSSLFEVQASNFLNAELHEHLRNGRYAPNSTIAFDGSNGEKIDQEELHSLLEIVTKNIQDNNNNMEPANTLINPTMSAATTTTTKGVTNNKYNAFQPEFYSPYEKEGQPNVSEPIFRLRKRAARGGRIMIDRRGLIRKSDFKLSDFVDFNGDGTASANDEDEDESMADVGGIYDNNENTNDLSDRELLSKRVAKEKGIDVYNSQIDKYIRHDSRWKYDNDFPESMEAKYDPFGSDPSKLNCISNDTQSIRFGSMLLSKAYESYREAQIQRQQMIIQNKRRMHYLQQQRIQQITQAKQAALQQRQLQQQQKQHQLQQQQSQKAQQKLQQSQSQKQHSQPPSSQHSQQLQKPQSQPQSPPQQQQQSQKQQTQPQQQQTVG